MQYIHIKVVAGASKEIWKEKSSDHFEISVKEKELKMREVVKRVGF